MEYFSEFSHIIWPWNRLGSLGIVTTFLDNVLCVWISVWIMLEFVIMDPPKTHLQFKSFWPHILAINKTSTHRDKWSPLSQTLFQATHNCWWTSWQLRPFDYLAVCLHTRLNYGLHPGTANDAVVFDQTQMSTYLWLPTAFSVHSQMPEKTADSFILLYSLLNIPKTVCFVCVLDVCVPACWRRGSAVPVWFSPSRSAVLPSRPPARYRVPSYPPRDYPTSWTRRPREDSPNCWD